MRLMRAAARARRRVRAESPRPRRRAPPSAAGSPARCTTCSRIRSRRSRCSSRARACSPRDRGVDDEVTRAIDQAHHLAASGLEDARRAIAAARGDELPGPERIGLLADAFGEQSGLPVAVEVRGEPRELAPDARLAVYRTAQEALTNVRRHAAAERVEIELSYLPQSTVLVVEDRAGDGRPAACPARARRHGYGLTGMRERAELLGGELLAEPTDNGFRVELRLPT